ncbi:MULTISPECIES: PD-(D/E)XK motif protein [unclassified Brevundimonas]|uniref:PD-(D/E)XK motif protein n=1 Tax=unclassified Brevundimonas TaxID=2622653 RepID=UPI000B0AA009|nr:MULTISPECIES: PD-(D/E)XK motif protein [unclassified Brevundimonas]
MSRTTSDIHTRWATLRTGSTQEDPASVAASDLGVTTGYGNAMLSISPEGWTQLLLPVAPGTKRPVFADLPVIEVGANQLSDASGSRPYLIVSCREASLDRAFADLVLAVLSRIEDGESPSTALTEAVRDLRALFVQAEDESIGIEQVQGLVAELLVLLRLANRHARAPEVWFGPDKDRHDFRGGVHAIEVKSSRRRSGTVTISSIDQLDIPMGGSLELWRVVLDRTSNGAVTVARLVEDIEARTGSSKVLRERLKGMGCPDPSAGAWNNQSFNCEAIDAFAVEPGFPRIVAETFGPAGKPAGIGALKYEIDLAQAGPFALTEADMKLTEDRVLACLK